MEASNQRARSTSSVTAAAGKQTSRATRGAGVGSIETTLICNLTDLQQLLLPLTQCDRGCREQRGGGVVETLNISVGGVIRTERAGPQQSVSLTSVSYR